MADEARAVLRGVRVPPRQARLVMDLVRGKPVGEAEAILRFTPNKAARIIQKVLQSAVANAENNEGLDADRLTVAAGYVDEGPRMKRVQPRAQGRAYRILKRTSHITVVVTEAERVSRYGQRRRRPPAQEGEPVRRGGRQQAETAQG